MYQLVCLMVGISFAVPQFTHAAPARTIQARDLDQALSGEDLKNFAVQAAQNNNPFPIRALGLTENFSDQAISDLITKENHPVFFRDEVVTQIVDTLVREKGKFPIVVGETGVGKTSVLEQVTRDLVTRKYPSDGPFAEALDDVIVLRLSARNVMTGGYDFGAFLEGVRQLRDGVGRNIIVMLYESHFLADYQIGVLREEMDRHQPIPIILETDSKNYGNSIKAHPSFVSIAQPIIVREFKPDQVKEIIRKHYAKQALKQWSVRLNDDLIDNLVDISPEYRKDLYEPRRSLTLLEDISIQLHREKNGELVQPTREQLFKFVAKQIGLPVLPQDEQAFSKYMDEVRERIRNRVRGQDHMVDGIVDQFVAALTSRTRQHTVALALGPTGVGKTLVGEVLAEEFYGDKSRFMELDMTQFSDTHGLTSLFGAANGYISSDKEKGALCDFFDGRAKGGGILVMNEIEEMSSDVFTRFMEIMDKGEFRGGDGKVRHIGKTIIIMTSNKNSDKVMAADAIKGMTRDELKRRLSLITQDQLKKAFTEKASYTERETKVVKAAVLERVDRLYFAAPLLADTAVDVTKIELDKFKRDYEKRSTDRKIDFDDSVAQVMTQAFYNEAMGARQVRTAVQQSLTQLVQAFRAKYGYDVKELQITATTHKSKKTVSYLTATDPATGNTLTIDGPTVPVANKMLDPTFRERIASLEANLKSEIFGQDEAVNAIASAVKSRFMRGGKENVVAGFMVGMTGSGKSQIAKSLAKFLYGRPDAYALFEMGRIQTEHDLSNIFSPAKGIIGSDQPGELEKFLIQHPDGGVLLFDEMSNAGGANKALKAAIAKQFYTMLQEGVFKTPTGKTYDLSNFVIIMTGNDGEEIFRGLTSDSMLEETYKWATKNPGRVEQILRDAGFPEAFVGRLSFAVLMRPTLGDVKVMIAKKLINEWRDQLQANQPFDIIYDDEFVREVGLLMFSPRTGARSINRFVDRVLGQAVGDEALKVDWNELLENGKRAQIHLSLKITKPEVPFYKGDEPDKKEAVLNVEVQKDGEVISRSSVDFTAKASFIPQVHEDIARATAYHEMAHAVASFTEFTGKKLVKITIIPEKIDDLSALGYAQYRFIESKHEWGRRTLVMSVAGLLAGSEAEDMIGRERTSGRSNDVQRVGDMTRKMILEHHLVPELDVAGAYIGADGSSLNNLPADVRERFDTYVREVIEEARELARKTLREQWHIVEAGVEILMARGIINEHEFEALVEAGQHMTAEESWFERIKHKWFGFDTSKGKGRINVETVLKAAADRQSEQEGKSCETLLAP